MAGLAVSLASCKTPYAQRLTEIDWTGSPLVGKISVSQPKLYRRESLINERRDEVEWIKRQLDTTQTFGPEIQRELEQITAFAAAIGLDFDPAGGAEYRRDAETGEIRHQINVLQLQLQLDQLNRDAQLMRDRFAAQTEPSRQPQSVSEGASPGKADASGAPQSAAGQSSVDKSLADLKTLVGTVIKGIETRLGNPAQDIATSKSTVNPSDQFRDQLAYRDLLKAARNAASLDDLHDADGRALIRLNFQATAVPDRQHSRVPGIIQMAITPPPASADEWDSLYRRWLDHINQKINRFTADGWEQDAELIALADANLFSLTAYYVPRTVTPSKVTAAASAPAAGRRASAAARPDISCNGYGPGGPAIEAACAKLVFAVPRFVGKTKQEGAYSTLDDYAKPNRSGPVAPDAAAVAADMHAAVINVGESLVQKCRLPSKPQALPSATTGRSLGEKLFEALQHAKIKVVAGDEVSRLERAARFALGRRSTPMGRSSDLKQRIADESLQARFLLQTFEDVAYRGCTPVQRKAFRDDLAKPYRPPLFADIISAKPLVSVYEIGPRELVQQVSSVSRIANSLSLALSLAAAKPKTGLGATAAGNFSRQAIGKAATFERIPSLIGYAAPDSMFGWVILPKAVFDPDGEIVLEQGPRTMDLVVDLSIPAWWPYFELQPRTGWGSNAASVAADAKRPEKSPGPMRVPMIANSADLDQLTIKLQRGAQTQLRLEDPLLTGQAVAACHATTLYVRGANLWRASTVVVAGHKLDGDALTVVPDMSGILLTVPGLANHVNAERGARLALSVFTRDGEASGTVKYDPPAPSGCVAPLKASVVQDTKPESNHKSTPGAAKAEAPKAAPNP